jgi:predicted nucleotidyltransferase
VKQLANRYRLYGVVFSGSRARGDYKPWSGYDLLVIGAFEEPYLERLAKILGALKDTSLPWSLTPTPSEKLWTCFLRATHTL